MTPTRYRDQVAQLAKTDAAKAAAIAEKISDPWFQAQAWAHVARYAQRPLQYSRKSVKSAARGKDNYQRSAVRAWEIAALAERGYEMQARRSLSEAVELARTVEQAGSRSEALLVLFQAAFKISNEDARRTAEVIQAASSSSHWRSKRARKDVELMLNGDLRPREFFR
jgi:hypothetical protein